MHIATRGFWDLNFNLFFFFVKNACGKCLFKKKNNKRICSAFLWGTYRGLCFLAAEFIRCAQLILRIRMRALLCSSFQMMWLASVCRMERSWLFWPPWLNLQRTAYTPRVEENTEVRFHLCPSCLTLIKPLLSSAPSSSTSFNFSHLWGHCVIKDL